MQLMSNIKLFQDEKIRATYNEKEQKWYFAIIDVVQVLTESSNARRYWSDLKRKLVKEGFNAFSSNKLLERLWIYCDWGKLPKIKYYDILK